MSSIPFDAFENTRWYFNHMMKTGGRTAIEVIRQAHKDAATAPICRWLFVSEHKMCEFVDWDITATIIREPTSRLLSHYRMLMQHELSDFSLPHHREASFGSDDPVWLGDNFEDFLIDFPNKWKLHQLHFYSESADVDEAFNNITQNTQIILFERRKEGFDRLAKKVGLDPALFQDQQAPEWQTTKNISFEVDDNQASKMKKVLEKEYEFYNRVINYYNEEKI